MLNNTMSIIKKKMIIFSILAIIFMALHIAGLLLLPYKYVEIMQNILAACGTVWLAAFIADRWGIRQESKRFNKEYDDFLKHSFTKGPF